MTNDPAVSAITRLEQLAEKWRTTAQLYRDFHATLGTGWEVCADELEEALAALLSSGRAVHPEEVLNCQWAIDDKGGDSVYETSCGHNFYFDDSSDADENGFRCCPYCGLRLVEVKMSEATND